MSETSKPTVGVSIGDVNGIGPEVILKVFSDARLLDICSPIIYGSSKVLNHFKKLLQIHDISLNVIPDAKSFKKNKVNIIECTEEEIILEIGHSTSQAGKLAFDSLTKAVDDIKSEVIDVLITAPINKMNVRQHYPNFSGHTGYLAEKDGNNGLMVLCSEKMRIAMVTGHVALSDVNTSITIENVISKLEALNRCLRRDFGIARPRIAVLGLNPHAGEEGIMGKEEQEIILPAIDQVKTKGIIAVGPYPSDGFFGSANYLNFDGVLAMYHDQALIPFKTISFESGVNFTSELNFVRTSPDHGTAYEIAGKGRASASSMRAALYAACDIFKRRKEEISLIEV